MQIKNITKNTLIAKTCKTASTFFTRFMGLMGKSNLPQESGLVIAPCNSIHMCFMKFPLDIVFLDKTNTVVFLIENIQPWQFSKLVLNAHSVIELPVGTIKKSSTTVGDKIVL